MLASYFALDAFNASSFMASCYGLAIIIIALKAANRKELDSTDIVNLCLAPCSMVLFLITTLARVLFPNKIRF